MEDCYYFLYSQCSKPDCVFRHCLNAKENPILCKTWKLKKQCKIDCPFRHSTYHLNKKRHEMMCYWEKTTGCTKEYCEFRHENSEKDAWKESRVKSLNEIVGKKCKKWGKRKVEMEEDEWRFDEEGDGRNVKGNGTNGRDETKDVSCRVQEQNIDIQDTGNWSSSTKEGDRPNLFLNEKETEDETRKGEEGDQSTNRKDMTKEERHRNRRDEFIGYIGDQNSLQSINHTILLKGQNRMMDVHNKKLQCDDQTNDDKERSSLTLNNANNNRYNITQYKNKNESQPDKFVDTGKTKFEGKDSICEKGTDTFLWTEKGIKPVNTSGMANSSVLSTQNFEFDETELELASESILNRLRVCKRKADAGSTVKRLKWREKLEMLEKNLKAAKRKSLCTIENALDGKDNK